ASGNSLWGDMVQFAQYDILGRESTKLLPYTTTNQSGNYKSTPLLDQIQYYSNNYNEGHAYYQVTYDNSPLNRAMNVKAPGDSWNAGLGNS
ncbi:DUF6443 domain-containing protein, partial [Vibrio parahaemolyticus]